MGKELYWDMTHERLNHFRPMVLAAINEATISEDKKANFEMVPPCYVEQILNDIGYETDFIESYDTTQLTIYFVNEQLMQISVDFCTMTCAATLNIDGECEEVEE